MIVDTSKPITSESCREMVEKLIKAYPFCRTRTLTETAFGRPVQTLEVGDGPRKVFFSAAHHANEWITTLVLLRYAEELAQGIVEDGKIWEYPARRLAEQVSIHMVPMVDPDGVDLVVGAIKPGDAQYAYARAIGEDFPSIPFPDGWKANLLGTDLNLNYPAGWLQAREIKFSQGYTQPAPRDFVGAAPLDQKETRALAEYTEMLDPALVLACHTQGREIYWQFRDIFVPGAEELGQQMARVSGYTLAEVPYESAFAGYKDWFIQEFRRPGYTVEMGRGQNPLPLAQFPEIYRENVGLLTVAALGENPLEKEENPLTQGEM